MATLSRQPQERLSLHYLRKTYNMADEEKKTETTSPEASGETVKAEETKVEETAPETPAHSTGSPPSAENTETEGAPEEPPAETEPPADPPSPKATEGQGAPAETEELTAEQVLGMKIRPGMVLRVHQKIKEMTPKGDERERIQVFEGTVIARKGKDPESATITVRKVSGGIGVERIFPIKSPNIAKFEVVKEYRTRRSKLYFLRRGYKKRLKEK